MQENAGAALRAMRRGKGLNQGELADLVGVTGQSVSAWESGKNDPSPDNVRRLDAALEADGELIRAFALIPPAADITERLAAAVDRLEADLRRLRREVEDMRNRRGDR